MDRRAHPRHHPHPTLREDEGYSSMHTPARRRSPSPVRVAPSETRAFTRHEIPAHRQSYPSPPTLHQIQSRQQDEYNYRPPVHQHHSPDHPPRGPPAPPSYPRRTFDHHREKSYLPPVMSKELPPHLQDPAYQHGLNSNHFGRFMSIFDSPFGRTPANKGYYANDDPASCAAAAKRYGINLEDAYLLLDFHHQ